MWYAREYFQGKIYCSKGGQMDRQINEQSKKRAMKRAEGGARFGAIAILWVAAFAILAVVIRTSSHAQLAPIWLMFHHDLNHTGLSPFNTNNNAGALKWKFTTDNHVESSPSIGSDGTVYFGSDDGNVYAVDASGNQKWKFTTLGSSIVRSSPAIGADGTIYFGSEGGRSYAGIYALNPDGTQKWYFRTAMDVFRVRVHTSTSGYALSTSAKRGLAASLYSRGPGAISGMAATHF